MASHKQKTFWSSARRRLLLQLSYTRFNCSRPAVVLALVILCITSSLLVATKIHFPSLRDRGILRLKPHTSNFEQAEREKALMPRSPMCQNMTVEAMHQQLPVWVLSLARATRRRQHVIQTVRDAGLTNYEIIDPVDYMNASSYTLTELYNYTKGWRRHMWHKQSPWIRSKIAVDLSHYRLLERIVNTGRPAVILEDDAALTGTQWLPDLLTALQELPQDWDILYLNALLTRRGRHVSPHLIAIRGTVATIGYIPTPAFARKVLEAARSPKQSAWVDLIFAILEETREAQAYMVEPPLVLFADVDTTLAKTQKHVNTSAWDALWHLQRLGQRHLR